MLVVENNPQDNGKKKSWLTDDSIKRKLDSKPITLHLNKNETQKRFYLLKDKCKGREYGFNITMNPDLADWIIDNAFELSKLWDVAKKLGEDPLEWSYKRILEMVKQVGTMNLKDVDQLHQEKNTEIDVKCSIVT